VTAQGPWLPVHNPTWTGALGSATTASTGDRFIQISADSGGGIYVGTADGSSASIMNPFVVNSTWITATNQVITPYLLLDTWGSWIWVPPFPQNIGSAASIAMGPDIAKARMQYANLAPAPPPENWNYDIVDYGLSLNGTTIITAPDGSLRFENRASADQPFLVVGDPTGWGIGGLEVVGWTGFGSQGHWTYFRDRVIVNNPTDPDGYVFLFPDGTLDAGRVISAANRISTSLFTTYPPGGSLVWTSRINGDTGTFWSDSGNFETVHGSVRTPTIIGHAGAILPAVGQLNVNATTAVFSGQVNTASIRGTDPWDQLNVTANTTMFRHTIAPNWGSVACGALHVAAINFQVIPTQTPLIGVLNARQHAAGGFQGSPGVYYATDATYEDFRLNPGRFEFFSNTGLTVNQTFTPDLCARIDGTGIDIPAGRTYKVNGVPITGGGGGGIPEPTTAGSFLRTNASTWVAGLPADNPEFSGTMIGDSGWPPPAIVLLESVFGNSITIEPLSPAIFEPEIAIRTMDGYASLLRRELLFMDWNTGNAVSVSVDGIGLFSGMSSASITVDGIVLPAGATITIGGVTPWLATNNPTWTGVLQTSNTGWNPVLRISDPGSDSRITADGYALEAWDDWGGRAYISPWQLTMSEAGSGSVTINTGNMVVSNAAADLTWIFPASISMITGGATQVTISPSGIELPAGATIKVGGVQVYP